MTHADNGARQPATGAGKAPHKYWRRTFLAKLAETSSVEQAAEAANITLDRAQTQRREDPDFARQWQAALDEGYDRLEMDLLYRLRSGRVEEADEDGGKRKFDLATSFRILAAHRQRQQGEGGRGSPYGSEAEVITALNARIDAFRARRQDGQSTPIAGGQVGDGPE